MSEVIEYCSNRATAAEIADHLVCCDADFVPSLSGRVQIRDYAQKIATRATTYEAWLGGTLIGLVAFYCNDLRTGIAYITSVSVLKPWTGKGVAARLVSRSVEHAKASGMRQVRLQVAEHNAAAIKLYERSGFVAGPATEALITMGLSLSDEGHGSHG